MSQTVEIGAGDDSDSGGDEQGDRDDSDGLGNGEDKQCSGGSDERDGDDSGAAILSPHAGALTVGLVLCCLAAYWL